MFEAAAKALNQMLSPEFRQVLLKSIGLALVLIVIIGVGLHQLLSWMTESGATWAESHVGMVPHTAWQILVWVVSIMATLGIITGGVFLMPAVTAFAGTFFVDEIADAVERRYYPADPAGHPLPLWKALIEGSKTALLTIAVYLCALPFLLLAGVGLVIMFLAAGYLLGREYFLLAAMRFRSVDEAKAFRKQHASTVFASGCVIAAFVSIPIVNLATPLFGTAFMVHMHKRLSGPRPELLEPARTPPTAA
jgi:uncharacterized protein involved in cysteine biosynthesis